MVRGWPTKKNDPATAAGFVPNQKPGFVSPRKPAGTPNSSFTSIPAKDQVVNMNHEDLPRFASLFDSKAEIKYTPENDRDAARAYADSMKGGRAPAKSAPHTSGYDFDSMLKDVKVEYKPWG